MKTLFPALEVHTSRSKNHSNPPGVAAFELALVEETSLRALSEWVSVQPKTKHFDGDRHG